MSKQPQENQPRRKHGAQSPVGRNKDTQTREETSSETSQQTAGKAQEPERAVAEADDAPAAPLAPTPHGRRQLVLDYLRPAIVLTLVMTVLLGIAYPLLVTGVAQVLFNHQANGSL